MFKSRRFARFLLPIKGNVINYQAIYNVNKLHFTCALDQNELLQLLKEHNSSKQQRSTPTTSSSSSFKSDDLMENIRKLINESSINDELAINACFFMTHYHTDVALSSPPNDINEFMKFQEIHYNDMNIGWQLLNKSSSSNSEFNSSKSIWKIETATRLEDTFKIYYAFNELYNYHNCDFNNFTNDELMISIGTIPYFAQWTLLLNISEIINDKIPDAFISLHNMSQNIPIPDFSMIYELISDNKDLYLNEEIKLLNDKNDNDIIEKHFNWNFYEFEGVRLKFKKVNCYKSMDDMSKDTKKEDLILNNMNNDNKQWKQININGDDGDNNDNNNNNNIRKMGGIIETKSFYGYGDMAPIQLHGPCSNNLIKVKGKVDIPIFNEKKRNDDDNDDNDNKNDDIPGFIVIHEEEWDLKKDNNNPKVFKGEYYVRQRNEIIDKTFDPNSEQMENFAPMDWIYDLEITLK